MSLRGGGAANRGMASRGLNYGNFSIYRAIFSKVSNERRLATRSRDAITANAPKWEGDLAKRQFLADVEFWNQTGFAPDKNVANKLAERFANGLVMRKPLSVTELDTFAKVTSREWGMYRYRGQIILQSGDASSVRMFADNTTDFMVHAHFNAPGPSRADINIFRQAINNHAKIDSLDIVYQGRLYRYSEEQARLFAVRYPFIPQSGISNWNLPDGIQGITEWPYRF